MPPPRLPAVGRNLVNQRGAASGANSDNFIPAEILCSGPCHRSKPKDMYSNRQLKLLSDSQYNPYAPGGRTKRDPKVMCRACTAKQTAELTCWTCNKTKGLDKFAKNQRKNPDRARCIKCVEKHLDTEPNLDFPDSDGSSDSDSEGDFDALDTVEEKHKAPGTLPAARSTSPGKANHYSRSKSVAATFDDPAIAGSTVSSDFDANDEWETVPVAATKRSVPAKGRSGASSGSSRTDACVVRKNGWAVVDKVQKGKEKRWGEDSDSEHEEVEDEWNAYGRALREKREGKKSSPKKQAFDDLDDGEEW